MYYTILFALFGKYNVLLHMHCASAMFKSCKGFEIEALCIGVKKHEYKKPTAKQEKKSRKFQGHCVQNYPFQGFYKYKKIQKQFKEIREFKYERSPCSWYC